MPARSFHEGVSFLQIFTMLHSVEISDMFIYPFNIAASMALLKIDIYRRFNDKQF